MEDQLLYASFVDQVVRNDLVLVEAQGVMIPQLLKTWNGEVKISHKNHDAKRKRMKHVTVLVDIMCVRVRAQQWLSLIHI